MEPHFTTSPRWSSTTKLLVGLVMIGIVAFYSSVHESDHAPIDRFYPCLSLHPATTCCYVALNILWKAASIHLFYYPYPSDWLCLPWEGLDW